MVRPFVFVLPSFYYVRCHLVDNICRNPGFLLVLPSVLTSRVSKNTFCISMWRKSFSLLEEYGTGSTSLEFLLLAGGDLLAALKVFWGGFYGSWA